GQLGLGFHVLLADLHDVDPPGKSRLQEAFEITLLFPSVRAQVEPGEAEACLQAHQHSHEATIMAVTWLSALALGASQLPKIDPLLLVHHKTGPPIAKEPTVFNVMCLAIQQVEEIFLQGFATGAGLGREHAAGGFRDAANLESDHEGIFPLTVSGVGSSQSGERAVGAEQLATCHELAEPLRRFAGYRPAVAECGRLEAKVREPRDARRLGGEILGDHPRRSADLPLAPPTDRVAREQHSATTVEEERDMAGCM